MKLYKYEELPEVVKDLVRQPYAQYMMDIWREPVLEDFDRVAGCLGLDLRTYEVRDELYYPIGNMNFDPEMVQKIRSYAPLDEELHQISEGFLRLQSECKFRFDRFIQMNWVMDGNRIDIEWRFGDGGKIYSSSSSTSEFKEFGDQFLPYVDRLIQWLNRQLQKEYEWVSSEEAIAEYCENNEMIFTAEGNLYVGT